MGIGRAAHDDPRRSGARILDTAEGVIIALVRCNITQAFTAIVGTAKDHNVAPLSLADALVAIAQNHATDDLDPEAVRVAHQTWGRLLDRPRRSPEPHSSHERSTPAAQRTHSAVVKPCDPLPEARR
jgi:Fe-S-cluster formation regulator IscX/YfhJ